MASRFIRHKERQSSASDRSKLGSSPELRKFLDSSVDELVEEFESFIAHTMAAPVCPQKSSVEELSEELEAFISSDYTMASPVCSTIPEEIVPDDIEPFFPLQKLPPELRAMIWENTLPGPRIVEIDVELCFLDGRKSCIYRSNAVIPSLLHIHRESREIGSKDYELSFGCSEDRRFGGVNTVWANFALDTFYFRPIKGFNEFGSAIICNVSHLGKLAAKRGPELNITRLALPIQCASSKVHPHVVEYLSRFPHLTELFLIGDEIKSACLQRSQSSVPVDPTRRRLVDTGEMPNANRAWAADLVKIQRAFAIFRYKDWSNAKVPQLIISAKFLVRG
jgi:hypothetical protein